MHNHRRARWGQGPRPPKGRVRASPLPADDVQCRGATERDRILPGNGVLIEGDFIRWDPMW